MEQLPEITPDDVLTWAKSISDAAFKAFRKNTGRYVDYSESVKLLSLAYGAREAGIATDAGWLRITTCYQWLRERAKDDDKLGSLCSDFLNRTGLY